MTKKTTTPQGRIDDGTFTFKNQSAAESQVELTRGEYADSTPIECDTKLAELYDQRAKYSAPLNRMADRLKNHEKEVAFRAAYPGKVRNRWDEMDERAIESAKKSIEHYQEKIAEVDALIEPINEEYDARGTWTRFFLVRNTGGHIHSSTYCRSCSATTNFVWLPDRSGSDEAETVEMAGDAACTWCYPSAPVADKNNPRPNQLETAEVLQARAERIRVKEAKAAKALVTGIWGPDGEPLREATAPGDAFRGHVIEKERTAEIRAVDLYISKQRTALRYSDEPNREPFPYEVRDQDTYDRIVEALASKRNQTSEEVIETLKAKAAKRK